MKKRLTAMILALAMVILFMPAFTLPAFAGDDVSWISIYYDKSEYYENEPFDFENCFIDVYDSNYEYSETISVTPEMVPDLTTEKVGKYVFEVSYGGSYTDILIRVKHQWEEQEDSTFRCSQCGEQREADSLWSYADYLEIVSKGKDVYNEGDVFDFEGWTLCCWYDDGSSKNVDITPDMLDGEETDIVLTNAGYKFIDIIYEDCNTALEVTVNHTFEAPSGLLAFNQKCSYCGAKSQYVTGVECVSEPSRVYYLEDEVFAKGPVDYNGLVVNVSYKGFIYRDRTVNFTEGVKPQNDALFLNSVSVTDEEVFYADDRMLESNYAFFDCEDNGDGTYGIYINTLGSRNLVTTVTYEHSNVTGITIDSLFKRYSTLEEMEGSVLTVTYADGSSEEITVSEDNICDLVYSEVGYYGFSEEQNLSEKGIQGLRIGDNFAVLHFDEGKMSYMGCECDVYYILNKIELMENSEYLDDGRYITMTQSTDIEGFYKNIKDTYEVCLSTPEGEDFWGETVGTGLELTMFRYSDDADPEVVDSRTVILPGDCSGDGIIDVVDVKLTLNASLNKEELTGAYFLASDVDHNSLIDVVDVKLILNVSLGKAAGF